MGLSYSIVNLDTHQYITPGRFNDGSRLREFATARFGTLMALAALLVEGNEHGGGIHSSHELLGSWAGDRMIILGEYADSSLCDEVDASKDVDITEHILQALWKDGTLRMLMVEYGEIVPPRPQSIPLVFKEVLGAQ